MRKSEKFFAVLVLLLICSVSLPAKEAEMDRTVITHTKQLKGVWEALYNYQGISRRERANIYVPPFPQREEFEPKDAYQKRMENLKQVYKRRAEKVIKQEIKNEQDFENTIFILEFKYNIPQDDRMVSEQNMPLDLNQIQCYEEKEKKWAFRKKIGTSGVNIMELSQAPLVDPFFEEWKTQEDNCSSEESTAYLTFLLDKYNMETEKFPLIFPLSLVNREAKKWIYYTRKLIDWQHYTETFREANSEKTEQWLIKFDQIPAYVSLPSNKAKEVREKENELILQLNLQPVKVEKSVTFNIIYYTLEVKVLSAVLKDKEGIICVLPESIQ